MRPEILAVVAAVLALLVFPTRPSSAADTQLGVAHIGGGYSFSHDDYLNEGAAVAESIGSRCIKVALALDDEKPSSVLYARNSQWPAAQSLASLADTPHFRELFARTFDTFILVAFRAGHPASYWRSGLSADDERAEEACFAELTRHLLTAHAGTRKVFVIQNWEGDWAVRGTFDPATRPTDTAIAGMIRWLAARQRGVERGRREAGIDGPKVLHACEVNLVAMAMEQPAATVTTRVLPHVTLDLVSYSAWDSKDNLAAFERALEIIAAHHRTPAATRPTVYVGEFGYAETDAASDIVFERTAQRLAAARRFGCPYAVYWQIYCNEPLVSAARQPADYRGFWLVRPDGSRSPVCNLFVK